MSWNQLRDLYAEAAEEARRSRTDPPTACPLCGEPLRNGPDGTLYCAFDGWPNN